MNEIRLEINNYDDREELVKILVAAGYRVRVERTEDAFTRDRHHFVIIDKPEEPETGEEQG